MVKDSILSVSPVKDTTIFSQPLYERSYVKDTIVLHGSLREEIFPLDLAEETDSVTIQSQQYLSQDYASRHNGNPLPFNLEQIDGIFFLLLLCFLFFTHIYRGGLSFLKENIALIFSSDRGEKIHKQTTIKEIVYDYFLLFQGVVLIAISMYTFFMGSDSLKEDGNAFHTIIAFIILIMLYLVIKDLMYRITGYIFDQQRLMSIWRKTYVISIEMLSILYFIPTLLLMYTSHYRTTILIIMLIMFVIAQIMLFYQIIAFFVNEKFNFLQLIAYLCTFEILPYIFVLVGLVYLYRIDVLKILWP